MPPYIFANGFAVDIYCWDPLCHPGDANTPQVPP